MRKLYDEQIVDYNDGHTEFVEEFNREIQPAGAIVYNHESHSYQWIRRFEDIEFKHELLPYYFKVKHSSLPNGMDLTMSYEFDPKTEEDEEILSLWKEASAITYPIFDYDEEGDIYETDVLPISAEPTRHTVWLLNESALSILESYDMLMLYPIIKTMTIIRTVLQQHTHAPFDGSSDKQS